MATLAGLRRVNVPLFLKFKTDLLLRHSVARLPIQVKNLVDRTQVIFGMAMALQAPAHRERFLLVNSIHVVHLTVAAHAAYTAIDVHRMVEICKIRDLVDLQPADRLPALPALLHGGQLRVIGLYLRMAIHAGLRCRDIRVGRNIDVGMTIPAIHAELGHMDVVRERHRLNRLISRPHVLRREVIPVERRNCSSNDQEAKSDLQRQIIRPARKNISHATSEIGLNVREHEMRRETATNLASAFWG